ncbi:hypothetical protein MtrunA17_Chr8g0369141 [Medicago truncatula]|uniref:Uncharacterized protein n=1 Tax=Medicago truncatula TaxID=3880 RepID=A0A396GMU5_MEDTR|nr:hypothetical protein MtrunA17_Chr8g0369141 [Medicago truncatula]
MGGLTFCNCFKVISACKEVAHISSRKYNRCLLPFSVFYVAILTPARRVGEEKISDRSGAKF